MVDAVDICQYGCLFKAALQWIRDDHGQPNQTAQIDPKAAYASVFHMMKSAAIICQGMLDAANVRVYLTVRIILSL